MVVNQIFKRPTVEQVIFQIQFPNLFFIESKIPDIQLAIMKDFPESSLSITQPIMIAFNAQRGVESFGKNDAPNTAQKVWEFRNPTGYTLAISSNSLSISSNIHKTYNDVGYPVRFRDAIATCLEAFGKYVQLPFVSRIGLRYIDKCPVTLLNDEKYRESIKSSLSSERFSMDDVEEMIIRVVKRIKECKYIYQEAINVNIDKDHVTLDFDSFAVNVPYDKCLSKTDELHEIIKSEFFTSIKNPIIKYMNGDDSE